MIFTLETLKLITIALVIFLAVYLPIEGMTKNKAWYYRGLGLILFGLICYLFLHYIGWRIECYFENNEMKCGFFSDTMSYILVLFFGLMGIGWLIKDGVSVLIHRK